ncbi:hypothetical protein ACFQWF_23590 [Methylorubrum suomiense]
MQAFFSSDGSFVVQFLVIFLIILVLLVGAVLLFRRLSGRGTSLNGGRTGAAASRGSASSTSTNSTGSVS